MLRRILRGKSRGKQGTHPATPSKRVGQRSAEGPAAFPSGQRFCRGTRGSFRGAFEQVAQYNFKQKLHLESEDLGSNR